MSPSLPLLPQRLELGFVDHEQTDEHKESAQHHGSGHSLRRVVLGVESLLFRSDRSNTAGGVGILTGGQNSRRKFPGRQKGT